MATPGAVEISGRDLPQYDPSSEYDGSRLDYPNQETTLFLINDTSKDVEKNIRLNQISNITSGINPDPVRASGMVNRDFTGFSFDFKSIRSGDVSMMVLTDGPTGEVIKIKSNALYSGRNLGVVDPEAQRQYFGTLCSGKTYYIREDNTPSESNLSALAFRSITGMGDIMVTGILQSKLKQAQYNEDSISRIGNNITKANRLWYKTYSGVANESNSVYGDQLNLLWREGQVPYGENLFTLSALGAEVGYMCITARDADQAKGDIPLDFSRNRIIFLDLMGYRGQDFTSYLNIVPNNLKVGTTITMQVFPRAPFENTTCTRLMFGNPKGLMQLDPEIFKVVGESPYPFVGDNLTSDSRMVQPIRIHFLCVKDTISFETAVPGQAEPSILVSFNDIRADFAWNTNLWLGSKTVGYTAAKVGDKYPFGKTAGRLGKELDGTTDKWLARSFPSLPSRYYPMRSYFGDGGYATYADWVKFDGGKGTLYADQMLNNRWGLDTRNGFEGSLALRGVNHTYLFGTIDVPSDYNDLPQSHRLYTGYDYRYKNTGLNIP